jgi:hypothetical protein
MRGVSARLGCYEELYDNISNNPIDNIEQVAQAGGRAALAAFGFDRDIGFPDSQRKRMDRK